MKASEIRELSKEEMKSKLAEYEHQLVRARFQRSTGQLKQVHVIGAVKKVIARLKTIMHRSA